MLSLHPIMVETTRRHNHSRGSVMIGMSVALLAVGGGLLGGYAYKSRGGTTQPAHVDLDQVDDQVLANVKAAAEAALDRKMTLIFQDRQRTLTWRELGVEVDADAVSRQALALTRDSQAVPADYYQGAARAGTIPVRVDREATTAALTKLKAALDTAPRNARMDLEARVVHQSEPGWGIDVYGSVSAIEAAARDGSNQVELEGVELRPEVTVEDLGISDISTVLSRFETKFSVAETTRNDNLKMAASHIDGVVLQPGQTFSFNETVGARSLEEGYKVAHVITAGELVDGLAGGACQISTTLHGAAFFAGLDILSSTPHSRPSTYVQMGLDATVVWPNVDLKLRNSFDFPVVIHYRVARGEAVVEILGKKKVYDKVAFEREVEEQIDFDTVTREDNELPVGSMAIDQSGFYGYKLKRLRKMYRRGKLVKKNEWKLTYKPVTEYVRLGINPDPNLPPPKQGKGHAPHPPKKKHFRWVM